MQGEWVSILADQFYIEKDMALTFEGLSCLIVGKTHETVVILDKNSRVAQQKVFAGWRCDILEAYVKFEESTISMPSAWDFDQILVGFHPYSVMCFSPLRLCC